MSLERNGQVCEHVFEKLFSYGKQEWEDLSINTIVYIIFIYLCMLRVKKVSLLSIQ